MWADPDATQAFIAAGGLSAWYGTLAFTLSVVALAVRWLRRAGGAL
jgi:hypothetical protein